MIRHIVMWTLKDASPANAQAIMAEFNRKLERLKPELTGFGGYLTGLNVHDDQGYELCIDSWFEDQESLDAYIVHPLHLEIRDFLNACTTRKIIIDFAYDEIQS